MKTPEKKKNPSMVKSSLINDIRVSENHIRQRAFEIYVNRKGNEGTESTDWHQAEQELNRP